MAFEDVTVRTGLALVAGPGLGAVSADFNRDAMPDLFIANDGSANHLWLSNGAGRFSEDGLLHGVAYSGVGLPEANMGIALGDVDGNGLFDLFVTHLTEELHRLWLQDESGYFQDRTAQFGLAGARSTGYGTLFGDFDNDGDEDLVVANGMVKRRGNEGPAETAGQFWTVYAQRNFLLENHDRRFVDISASTPSFGGQLGVHRVIVTADFDNDGALDLLVSEPTEPLGCIATLRIGETTG